MVMVTLKEAAAQLEQLFESALKGETVVIVGDDQQQQIELVVKEREIEKRQFGSAKGLIWMADDFDAPLDDFAEYME